MIRVTLSRDSFTLLQAIRKRTNAARSKPFMQGLGKIAQRAAAHVVRTKLSGGEGVGRRTGTLARSVVGVATIVDGSPAIRVGILRGPALSYAGVIEYGTSDRNPDSPYPRIVPRQSKLMAQPVGKALTRAGVARWRGPRTYPGSLSFVPYPRARARGSPVVAGLYNTRELAKSGPKGAEPLYLLRRWTSVEPRRFLADGVEDYIPQIRESVEELLFDLLFGETEG